MSEPVKRGKPVTVTVVLDDALAEATLRALAFAEHSTMRKEARQILELGLARIRDQIPELAATAQLLVEHWEQAERGVSTHEARGGLRVVD